MDKKQAANPTKYIGNNAEILMVYPLFVYMAGQAANVTPNSVNILTLIIIASFYLINAARVVPPLPCALKITTPHILSQTLNSCANI